MKNHTRTLISLAAAAVVIFGVGCSPKRKSAEAYQDPFFPPRGATPASTTMMQKQFALGAAEDATLFDVHFDGPELSSLGQQKLDAMISARPRHMPLTVDLNLPKEDVATAARQAKVEALLRGDGLDAADFALAIGPNPAAMRSAAAGSRALDLQRSTEGNASASSESTNLPVMPSK